MPTTPPSRDTNDRCDICGEPATIRDGVIGADLCDRQECLDATRGRNTAAVDHPHADPGDGRTECPSCGKWVWPVIHSCKGIPVTAEARDRLAATDAAPYDAGDAAPATGMALDTHGYATPATLRALVDATLRERDHLAEQLEQTRQALTDTEALATMRAGVIQRHAAEAREAGRELEQARAERDHLAAVVRDLTDDDPCQYDHNDHCQAHQARRPCPQELIREMATAAAPVPPTGAREAGRPLLTSPDLAAWIRLAVGSPLRIAGQQRGEDHVDGPETLTDWRVRAVLAVVDAGGRPVCERCDQVIRPTEGWMAPLPGVGLWEHAGRCPAVEPTEDGMR